MLRAALAFGAVLAGAYMLVEYAASLGGFAWPAQATAELVGFVVRALGTGAAVTGSRIALSKRTLQVDPACLALTIHVAYAALVMAYPFRLRTRLLALVTGIPVIAAANIFRLVAVAFAAEVLPAAAFDFVHQYLFTTFMVAVALGLWSLWLGLIRAPKLPHGLAGVIGRALAVSLLLNAALLWARGQGLLSESYTGLVYLTPCVSLILVSRGETWPRKSTFLVGLAVAYTLLQGLLTVSGIQHAIVSHAPGTLRPTLWMHVLYDGFLLGPPIAAVVLFVGGRPSRIWGQAHLLAGNPGKEGSNPSLSASED